MRTSHEQMLKLGDIVAAAYDRMLTLTGDRKQAGQLTASSVSRLLCRTGHRPLARRMSGDHPEQRGTRS
jgi:hypothetical protein